MLANPRRTSFSALTSTLGSFLFSSYSPSPLVYAIMCRYGGYGEPEWGYGVRNIVFRSPDPKKGVDTWIRLQDGETRARVTLDDSYGRK